MLPIPNIDRYAENVAYTIDETSLTITAEYRNRRTGEHEKETAPMLELLQEQPFGLDANAAAFLCEWYPEYIYTVCEIIHYHPYSWMWFYQTDENGVKNALESLTYDGKTPDEQEFCENYGNIIRDAAFTGAIVILDN